MAFTFYGKQIGLSKDSDQEVLESVKRILMTNHGERINDYEFGSNLRRFLFEPALLVEDLIREIKISIDRYEPRAEILEVSFVSFEDEILKINIRIRNRSNGNIINEELEVTGA
jgi:phage baseplate assembly protein W